MYDQRRYNNCSAGADARICPNPYALYSKQGFGSIWGSTPAKSFVGRLPKPDTHNKIYSESSTFH